MSSFLSSVISSIGGNEQPVQGPPTTATTTPVKSGQQPRKVTSGSSDGNKLPGSGATALKRNAEANTLGDRAKKPRLEQDSTAKSTQNIPTTKAPASDPDGDSQSTPRPAKLPYLPYRGTASSTPPASVPKPQTKPEAVVPWPPPPPKKGSYQEVLARAKAVQQAVQAIGTIKHKPVEKISKRERERREAEAAVKAKQSPSKGPQNGKTNGSASTGGKPMEPVKERRKPVELSYKGTMRPANTTPSSTYKGTIGVSSATRPARPARPEPQRKLSSKLPGRDRSRSAPVTSQPRRTREPNVRYAGYASYSENDSGDEEEEENDDVASETSDMEATGFEVEEEEMRSLKAAKKEDEEAAKQEDELKRAKEEKRKKLVQLAARSKPRKF